MKFLVVNQETTANIYGHTYRLQSINGPSADVKDILVADDGSASELLRRHKDILSAVSFEKEKIDGFPLRLSNSEKIPNGSKILILRSGGIGDHIMLTPAIKAFRELRLRNTGAELWLAVQEDMFPIFDGNPFVDRLLPLPLPFSDFLEAEYVVDFSDSINQAIRPNLHLTDYYMKKMGIDPDASEDKSSFVSQDIITSWPVSELFAQMRKDCPEKLFVLLNWVASTHIKSLPARIFSPLTKKFSEIVFIVVHHESLAQATADDLRRHKIKAINLSSHMKTLYDYFTAISLSDVVVCSDTSTYHIASLYQKPCLVVIGPTYSILTKYYPCCHFVEADYIGKTCSSPCGRTKGACPEAKQLGTPYSPCLMSISENIIHEKFQRLVGTYLT